MGTRINFPILIHTNAFAGAHVDRIKDWSNSVQKNVAANPKIKDAMIAALEQLALNPTSVPSNLSDQCVQDLTEQLVEMVTAQEPPLPLTAAGHPISPAEKTQMEILLIETAKKTVPLVIKALSAMSDEDIKKMNEKEVALRAAFNEAVSNRSSSLAIEEKMRNKSNELMKSLEEKYDLIPETMIAFPYTYEELEALSQQLEQRAKELEGLFKEDEGVVYLHFFALCHIKTPKSTVQEFLPWSLYNRAIQGLFNNVGFMKKMIEFFPKEIKAFTKYMPYYNKGYIITDRSWIESLILKHPESIQTIFYSIEFKTKGLLQKNRVFFRSLIKKQPQLTSFFLQQADKRLHQEIMNDTKFLLSVIKQNPATAVSIIPISCALKKLFYNTTTYYLVEVLKAVHKDQWLSILQAVGHFPVKNKQLAIQLASVRPDDIRELKTELFPSWFLARTDIKNALEQILYKKTSIQKQIT